MVNLCGKCGQEEKQTPELKGNACGGCRTWHHLRCFPAGDRALRSDAGHLLCEKCAAKVDCAKSKDMPWKPISGPNAHSTILGGGGAPEEDEEMRAKDARIQELEAMLQRYKDAEMAAALANKLGQLGQPGGHLGQPAQGQVDLSSNFRSTGSDVSQLDQSTVGGATGQQQRQQQQLSQQNLNSSNVNGSSSISSFDRSQWRQRLPREVLLRTQAPAPLTKDQLNRRKTMNTVLPEFDGNPLKYLTFITAFLETAGDVCGFTRGEDMKRLRAALKGQALALVEAQLDNADNLDGIMATLQLSFGETHLILATM